MKSTMLVILFQWFHSIQLHLSRTVTARLSSAPSCLIQRTAQWLFIVLAASFLLYPELNHAQQNSFDREAYYRAVKYCRENSLLRLVNVKFGPIALSADKHVLCFDGYIAPDMHVSLMNDLEEGGLFVVRSLGGRLSAAIVLANLIRDRRATVVVYDYCVSACAEFFLTAPSQAYVVEGALVIWHNARSGDAAHPFCTFLAASHDGGPKKLRRGVCREGGDPVEYHLPMEMTFFKERAIGPSFAPPPDSLYVRRRLTSLYKETGVDRDFAWTLHPRYYESLFKTKIFYEAYPKSQSEVDAMVTRLGLNMKVIYDP